MKFVGYYTKFGYMGKLPQGNWMLFASREEFIEYVSGDEIGSRTSNV